MLFKDGLVIGHEKNLYRLQIGVELVHAMIRGKLKFGARDATKLPVIGDLVDGSYSGDQAVIETIHPRRSFLARNAVGGQGVQPLAANVDYVMIVSSLNQDLNFKRLDRYLTLALDGGAQPVIVLTKRDLNPDWASVKAECELRAPGVTVIATSAQEDWAGLEPFVSDGKVSVLLGSSGVGKSTLVNRLLAQDVLDTGGIRLDDDKGRHTTTSRSMWKSPRGGWIIDTPGMREVQLLANEDGLAKAFGDVEELFLQCRFTDCAHHKEPGCAVRSALDEGRLSWERWESYGKLEREIALQARKAPRRR